MTDAQRDELMVRLDERVAALVKWAADRPAKCKLPELEDRVFGNGKIGALASIRKHLWALTAVIGLLALMMGPEAIQAVLSVLR